MSMRRAAGYLTLVAVTTFCGCGTMANLDGRRLPTSSAAGEMVSKPFGGVRRDIEWVKSGKSPGNLMYVADLPFSFVGDIVTLPTTVMGSQSDSLPQEPGLAPGAKSGGPGPNLDSLPSGLRPSAN